MKIKSWHKVLIAIGLAVPFWATAQGAWDALALEALQSQVSDVPTALNTIEQSLEYLDITNVFVHINNDTGKPYATDDPMQSAGIRLTNFEIRLAAMEEGIGSLCYTVAECTANCPQASSLHPSYTCDPSCAKPHAPALISTLDPEPRIKNLANRLLALQPMFNADSPATCTPPSNGQSQKTPSKQSTQITGLFPSGS